MPRMQNTREIETIALQVDSPGTQSQLDFIHYGEESAGPKAYIQAALHADEIPPLLVAYKLMQLLDEADREGLIDGHIVLLPVANPIGLRQHVLGDLAGRYDLATGINFNRDYPYFLDQIAISVGENLVDDAKENTRLIRKEARRLVNEQNPVGAVASMRHALLKNAIDADIAIDLHCDWQSVVHIYTGTPLWPKARDLASYVGAQATLLASVSGGYPFDEALSRIWWELAERFPAYPIEAACLAATIELRGKSDVEEGQAEQDALALFHFLQARGLIRGDAPMPPVLECEATPLDGVVKISAPCAGVVSYNKKPGDWVRPGDVVCTLFDVASIHGEPGRIELSSEVEGLLYARRMDRIARPGQVLCRIASKQSRSSGSSILLDD